MLIILILFFIFYTILATLRLKWAVMFLIAALPAYLIRFTILGIPFTLLEVMILISFAVWFFANYRQIFANLRQRFISRKSIRQLADGNRKSKINRYPFDIEIILLLIISFIAVAIAGFSDSAFGIWKAYFFEPMLIFILVINLFGKEIETKNPETKLNFGYPKLSFVLWPLAISAFVVSVFAIYQKFTGVWILNDFWANEETRRVTSFFGYPNAVGLYLAPLVLVIVGWLFYRPHPGPPLIKGRELFNKERELYINLFIFITIVISIVSIYFAKSKGALIGVAVGLFVFGIMANKKLRWILIILALISVMGVSLYQPAREYIKGKIIYNKSLQIRLAGWQDTWAMLKDGRLIFGTGLANFQSAVNPYHTEGFFYNDGTDPEFHRHVVWNDEYKKQVWQPLEIYLYPHNIFLNFWTELGLVGMLLFIWIISKYIYNGTCLIKKYNANLQINANTANYEYANKYLTIGLICAMVVIVVHGMVDVPYFKNDLAVMFWVLIAMMGMVNFKLRIKN
ncbi:MAG: O-antigen ligase family protein [Patescibacteria group bacterium]